MVKCSRGFWIQSANFITFLKSKVVFSKENIAKCSKFQRKMTALITGIITGSLMLHTKRIAVTEPVPFKFLSRKMYYPECFTGIGTYQLSNL